MEYFFNIYGLVLNILTWSVVLYFLDKGIQRINKAKLFHIGYKIIIGFLIVFSTLNVVADISLMGKGFEENRNYWYWDMDKKAADWGMVCDGKLTIWN